ncbi:MAG: cytidylate kinase-like family protein [Deltaproteobacteria bacterium]|nr:cytidylate kinase-like family protein [Deltaproteobacteria bacterium]
MAVITISRQFGSGAEDLGKKLAKKLGYTFVDKAIVQMISKQANVSPNFVKLVESQGGSKLSKFISTLVSKSKVDSILSSERGYIDEEIYIDYLILIIAQIADEGNAIIMGRGSQYILKDHPDTFHILLINDFKNRVKYVMEMGKVSEKKATRVVMNEDKRRENLYGKLGKKDYNDASLYHLVLNLGRFSIDSALKQVLTMVNQ